MNERIITSDQNSQLLFKNLFILGPESGNKGFILGHTHPKILAYILEEGNCTHLLQTMTLMKDSSLNRNSCIDDPFLRAKVVCCLGAIQYHLN